MPLSVEIRVSFITRNMQSSLLCSVIAQEILASLISQTQNTASVTYVHYKHVFSSDYRLLITFFPSLGSQIETLQTKDICITKQRQPPGDTESRH